MRHFNRIIAPAVLFAVLAAAAHAATWPAAAAVRARYASSDAWLLDRDGEPLQQVRLDPAVRRLPWTPVAEISPALREAVLASEDRRFYEHAGVDWQALGSAAWQNLFRTGGARGASTITMQLAGLLEPALLGRGGQRTLRQKWAQAQAAREIERSWTKDEILEAYLNLSTFRGELVGVRAASEALFDAAPAALDRAQSLLLAALLRGPNAGAASVARRACALGQAMARAAVKGREAAPAAKTPEPSCSTLTAESLRTLSGGAAIRLRHDSAPHLAARVLNRREQAGLRLRSTLRADLQEFANAALERQIAELAGRQVEDGAVLVLDNATGDVLAYVGSSGERSRARQVDGVQAHRQAGSTLKPFLYELAIEREWLTAASLVDDSPVNLATPAGVYLPQDYDREFKGWISARTALASSLNIPAVRTLLLVTPDLFHERLRALGFDSLDRDADHYGYALALGGADVSLLALANAYRTLANGGVAGGVRVLADQPQPARQRVLPEGPAFIVADILADPSARAPTFGFDSPLATRHWSAVKTGTSKDMRDNWCVGFTSRYTVGVWVGNFSGAPMQDVSGITGAAPIWQELVNYLHREERSTPPQPPPRLLRSRVDFEGGLEASRMEWFLPNTVLATSGRAGESALAARIVYPGEGTIIALDPDIPAINQRVSLVAQPPRKGLTWRLGEERLGEGSRIDWSPVAGRHTLHLMLDESEQSRVQFEVRGAVRASPPSD
jgi:penicillin-binding protein 1C